MGQYLTYGEGTGLKRINFKPFWDFKPRKKDMSLKPPHEESLVLISIIDGASLFAFPAVLVPMVPWAKNPHC